MSDDEAAYCRRRHEIDLPDPRKLLELFCEVGTQAFGDIRMLKYQSTLKIFRAVQSAGQAKMTAKVGAGPIEGGERILGWIGHVPLS